MSNYPDIWKCFLADAMVIRIESVGRSVGLCDIGVDGKSGAEQWGRRPGLRGSEVIAFCW